MSDSRGSELRGVLIFLLILCIVTVALRCYTKYFIIKRFAIEDWLAVVALVLYVVYTAFGLLSVHHGLGSHLSDVPPAQRWVAFMWRHFCTIIYIVISALTKFIVGLFLLRLCTPMRWMRIVIWVMLAIVGVSYSFYFFLDIFAAQPPQYYWLRYAPNPPKGRVNDVQWAIIPTVFNAVLNVIVDWTLAILPMILLWNARLDRRTKISVCGVLAIGSIASVAAIVRIFYANQLLENPDYLYNFTDLGIWSTVEIGLALSASSLGTLRPLLRSINILSDTQGQVVTHFSHHISKPSGGSLGGGYVVRLDAKASSVGACLSGNPEGSYTSSATTRDISDQRNPHLDLMGLGDPEKNSDSSSDLAIQRT